jgi:hypothetical protein
MALLAGNLDLHTKRLVSWKLRASLESELVAGAFERAVKLRHITPQSVIRIAAFKCTSGGLPLPFVLLAVPITTRLNLALRTNPQKRLASCPRFRTHHR